MADWNAYYASHTASPEEAVGLIRSGDRVVITAGVVNEPKEEDRGVSSTNMMRILEVD